MVFLMQRENLTEFHTSECVARNQHSAYAQWDNLRVERCLERVRQIIKKYSAQSFSISIDKPTYDAVIPSNLRKVIGSSHYTWGVDAVCGFIRDWGNEHQVPMEYVFDTTSSAQKKEIERVMSHGEARFPGEFVGHYSFRRRQDVPAL